MGGCLQGYLFGVLGREACAARGAVGGCDGDGAPDFTPSSWARGGYYEGSLSDDRSSAFHPPRH